MGVIFALFFLLLGFIGGFLVACGLTSELLREHASEGKTLLDKYRITFINKD